MSAALMIPVLWKCSKTSCIQGTVGISSPELLFSPNATIKDLIAVINDKFECSAEANGEDNVRRVRSMFLYGTPLSRDRLLESVIVSLSAGSPRLVATTGSQPRHHGGSIGINVKTLTGCELAINCTMHETIDDVKVNVEKISGIPPDQQRLIFAGRLLDDHHTLSDYKICRDATLHLVLGLRGGGIPQQFFADISDDSLCEVRAFSETGPEWRIVQKGLNLEGQCKNFKCKAFGRWIIHPNRFNSFNLLRDGSIKCPICFSRVKPLTCGFYDCVWKYEGVRGDDQCHVSSPWKYARGEKYHRFYADEVHGAIEWISLLIVLQKSTASNATLDHEKLCSVCWSPSTSEENVTAISCGHSVHSTCMKEWSSWCKHSNVLSSCPICRKDLS